MKLIICRKFSDECPPLEVFKVLTKERYKTKYKQLKKGVGLSNMHLRHGYDCDDFVRKMYTFAMSFDGVKIPRFVANRRISQLKKGESWI